jgi:hypothetical protein
MNNRILSVGLTLSFGWFFAGLVLYTWLAKSETSNFAVDMAISLIAAMFGLLMWLTIHRVVSATHGSRPEVVFRILSLTVVFFTLLMSIVTISSIQLLVRGMAILPKDSFRLTLVSTLMTGGTALILAITAIVAFFQALRPSVPENR